MVSITISMENRTVERLGRFSWVNWSEVGREALMKKEILERYIKSGRLSDDEWKFCDKIDWHPADELPLKEEFMKRLKKAEKGHFIRLKSAKDIFE